MDKQHGYGYGGGGEQGERGESVGGRDGRYGGGGGGIREEADAAGSGGGSCAGGAAAAALQQRRPQGWSSLTNLLRNPSPPRSRDPFPPLSTAAAGSRTSGRDGGLPAATAVPAANNHNNSSGGERNSNDHQQQGQQQQQWGVSNSPTSSAGSFSSNYSGRNNHSSGRQTDAQAALSSNATAWAVCDPQGVSGAGSPPESSSGSFAPNLSHLRNNSAENIRGSHRNRSGRSGAASSAGSFALNPYQYPGQGAGAFENHLGGGFQPGRGVVLHGNGREREVAGSSNRGAQEGPGQQHQGEQAGSGHKSGLRRGAFHQQQQDMMFVDEDRPGGDGSAAAERIDGGNAGPAVSDGRSSIGDADRDMGGAQDQNGKDAADSTAASSAFHVPIEPEWEEEDLYRSLRSEALKESRARGKLAKGASQAYANGDHRKAKILAKEAEAKRAVAEKLHAEAASKILHRRNGNGRADIWHLDLHGLHTVEAVSALQDRLALLESGLEEGRRAGGASLGTGHAGSVGTSQVDVSAYETMSDSRIKGTQNDAAKHELFRNLITPSKHLSVVTGLGTHSPHGPTLPSAVKSFLINNGYQLQEPSAGVISVRPKLRFSV